MKRKIISIVSVIGFLGCAIALVYPVISDSWNSWRDHLLIDSYNAVAQQKSDKDIDKILQNAEQYNKDLYNDTTNIVRYGYSDRDELYEGQLNIDKGIMGYIEIPKIGITEPIYHYSDVDTLERGIGHIKGSSLPIGGINTHCLLTGHRGLPNRKFFTNLDKVEVNDVFYIHILTKVIAYKIYAIETVLPDEVSSLAIVRGKDLITLITCTPYGINSHRLLVKAERIDFEVEDNRGTIQRNVAEQEVIIDQSIYVLLGFVIFIILLFIVRLVQRIKRKGGAEH